MKIKNKRKGFLLYLTGVLTSALIFGLAIQTVFGQAAQAELVVNVTDATGAVIPAAHITLTEKTTGHSTEIVTDSDGSYHFTNLKPGNYRIKIEAANGFNPVVRENVTLTT